MHQPFLDFKCIVMVVSIIILKLLIYYCKFKLKNALLSDSDNGKVNQGCQ